MISKIGFKNIRVFKDKAEFELKPITVLTGTNNSGKSTVHKMLKLLKNSFKINGNKIELDTLEFDRNVINELGNFESNTCRFSNDKSLIFNFEFEDELYGKLNAEFSYSNGKLKSFIDCLSINFGIDKVIKFQSENFLSHLIKLRDEDLDKPSSERFDFNEKQIHPDERIYNIEKENIEPYLNSLHDQFLKIRDSGVLQDKIRNLDEKLDRKYTKLSDILTENELLFYNDLIVRGIKVGSDKAQNELDILNDLEDYADSYEFFVWDENENRRIRFSDKKRDFAEVFSAPASDELLINSKITELVLGKLDILNNEHEDERIKSAQKMLFESDISNKDEFKLAQKNVENFLILSGLIKLSNISNYYHGYDDYGEEPSSEAYKMSVWFDKILGSGKDIVTEQLESFLENNLFCEYFIDELKNDIVVHKDETKRKEIEKSNNIGTFAFINRFMNDYDYRILALNERGKYSNRNYLDIISETIMMVFKSPIGSLNQNLIEFIDKIDINLQKSKISRNIIFSEADMENPFSVLGTKYIGKLNFDKENSFINKWLKTFGIGSKLDYESIMANKEAIGISFNILDENGHSTPLGDNGLGINKIIEILINIVTSGEKKIIILEEPESNLHPSLQSKLADLFVDAYENFGARFIIETHSEYMIRKLQYIIAKDEYSIDSTDVAVYYLFDPRKIPEGKKQVYKMSIRKDGFMDNDFGKGFFDEASTLSLGLLNLTNFN